MYDRQPGDDLCSADNRLKLKWKWSRIATGASKWELKTWTHFQCSIAELGSWTLEATQWGDDAECRYEPSIMYLGDTVAKGKEVKTRLEAQINAEQLLINWITEQNKQIQSRLLKGR